MRIALPWLVTGALALGCGSEEPPPTALGGAGGQGGAPDADCLALCAQPDLWCQGPGVESASVLLSDITGVGCITTVMLPLSGDITLTIDCLMGEACVTAGDGGCAGKAGECYPTSFTASSFSYALPNCTDGSLSCAKN
jgi:hypothetical protein